MVNVSGHESYIIIQKSNNAARCVPTTRRVILNGTSCSEGSRYHSVALVDVAEILPPFGRLDDKWWNQRSTLRPYIIIHNS